MSESAGSHHRQPHGSMAEEAAALIDVAQLWLASQSAHDADVWARATADADEPAECRGCAYCRVRRTLSDVSPEVYLHLADAVSSIGAAVRALDVNRQSDGRR